MFVSLDISVISLIVLLNYASEIKLEEAAVLHYTYAKFSDLTSRRDRCGCKPTKEDVKRCFMLEFDRSVSFQSLLFVILSPVLFRFLFCQKTGFLMPVCRRVCRAKIIMT